MNVDIAERLAKRRREAGYSQENLAEKLGVSRQAVSKWERSESSPDTDNLIALAQLYGVSLDELLYVDESFKDDVEFEAADKAAERKSRAQAASASGAPTGSTAQTARSRSVAGSQAAAADSQAAPQVEETPADSPFDEQASYTWEEAGSSPHNPKGKVNIGPGGIHVNNGEDYVHVSWRDGVHVKDSEDGDEVHVSWSGIHVNEGKKNKAEGGRSKQGKKNCESFSWDNDGVVINGEEFESWHEAREKYSHGTWPWGKPKSYTVFGEDFDTLDDARAKYGPEVGTTIPVKRHYKGRAWVKFPFPFVAIIAYLMIGIFTNEWGPGLFVFFSIPVYYMIGHLVVTKKIANFFEGIYPLGCVMWFLYMAFMLNQPHPAWVIFLTIPVVEWIVHSISRSWRHRKRKDAVIDVEAEESSVESL